MISAAQRLGAGTPNPPRGGFFCWFPLFGFPGGGAEAERRAFIKAPLRGQAPADFRQDLSAYPGWLGPGGARMAVGGLVQAGARAFATPTRYASDPLRQRSVARAALASA